jgi:hypothetical protein
MNDFVNKVQKELNKLQKTFEKEGEVLLKRIRTRAAQAETNVSSRTKDISELIESQMKKIEPAFDKFYKELKTSAGKYGIDLGDIENRVRTTTKKAAARFNLGGKSTTTKRKTKKTAKKKKAKKTTAKKKTTTKKKSAKKSKTASKSTKRKTQSKKKSSS